MALNGNVDFRVGASYASINRQWRTLIEKRTFSTLKLTTALLDELRKFVTAERCSHVRNLELEVTLPEYTVAQRIEVESSEDQGRNNEAFTNTICTFFDILSSWPEELKIPVLIRSISPSDWTQDARPSSRQQTGMKLQGTDILHWRYMASYLKLLVPAEDIPLVPVISRLQLWDMHRHIEPVSASKLISRLSRLHYLIPHLSDNERKDATLRDRLKNDFALSLHMWPASLQILTLKYPGAAPADGDYPPFKRSLPGRDALCITLRNLSQRLRRISIEDAMIGPELFWPQKQVQSTSNVTEEEREKEEEPPHWPTLTSFHLTNYAAATPSGTWLFTRDPRVPDYEFQRDRDTIYMRPPMNDAPQDEFPDDYRTHPSPVLNELYIAAAHAAQNMPLLRKMELVAAPQVGEHSTLEHEILEHEARHAFRYSRIKRRAIWEGTTMFPLLDETKRAWEGVAERHGLGALSIENNLAED
ncbi:uncharacterized protein BDV14DRAFT_201469 [Aspergillus stella-maris]|uniref:uncharacterized protein n=1 Tax=Aspergillus stella-maris TaxID=1810926 RepID=UPI003CCE22E9